MYQLGPKGWGRYRGRGGSTLNQARLCPPLAYGLIKKTHLILADGGLTDTQGQDHGGHRAERGAFDLRRIGEAFWRWHWSWVLKDGWEVGGWSEHWEAPDNLPPTCQCRIRLETPAASEPLILNQGCPFLTWDNHPEPLFAECTCQALAKT